MPHLLVIGGSDAGIAAALAARQHHPGWDVTVVLADRYRLFGSKRRLGDTGGTSGRLRAPSSKTDKTVGLRLATRHWAGRSPADGHERMDVGSSKHTEVSTMSNGEAVPETRGVTAELLAAVDLGAEIEGMAGRQFRMRMFTFEPGAVFGPIHDHKDRPGIVYILQGTITDHRDGAATDYGPGVGWPEDRNTTHWLENRGTVPAVEISVDIVRSE